MSDNLTHYGVMFSYYSAKTRAYLSYKRIPFVERYSASELSGRIREITHKVMIPVVETAEGEVLQDTTIIIDTLEARYPERPIIPDDPVLLLLTRIAEFIMDELWISTAMNTRWNDPVSRQFIISEFGRRIGGSVGLFGDEALAMGEKVAAQMQSYLPGLGVADEAGQLAANTFFQSASLALNQAVGPARYALGARPSLMDFCLFTGYYAHQYRDAGDAQLFLKTKTPDLCYYLDNLHAAQCAPDDGDLALTDSFLAYLKTIGPSGAWFAEGIISATESFASSAQSGQVFQHAIDPFAFKLGSKPFQRGGNTFSAWKLQRVHDIYESLSGHASAQALDLAEEIGWRPVLETKPSYRLERKDHLIYLQ